MKYQVENVVALVLCAVFGERGRWSRDGSGDTVASCWVRRTRLEVAFASPLVVEGKACAIRLR